MVSKGLGLGVDRAPPLRAPPPYHDPAHSPLRCTYPQSFIGYAWFCSWKHSMWIPVVMGLGLALFSVPELDFYLARRYPGEWAAYVEAVPWSMVPFVW